MLNLYGRRGTLLSHRPSALGVFTRQKNLLVGEGNWPCATLVLFEQAEARPETEISSPRLKEAGGAKNKAASEWEAKGGVEKADRPKMFKPGV